MVAQVKDTEPMLVDAREASRLLCISESTLARLTRAGNMPAVQIGRALRYDPTDLRGWIERQKTSEPRCLA